MRVIGAILIGVGGWFIFSAFLDVIFGKIERRVIKEDPDTLAEWRNRHPGMTALEDGSEEYGRISRRALPWAIPMFVLGMLLLLMSK
jgi:hypothetical protein